MRIFSDIYVRTDPDENGFSIQTRVPIKWGDMSRIVASILTGNTENIVLSAPAMAAWIADMEIDDQRRCDPMWVSKVIGDERAYDPITQTYTDEVGNRYSIERYMPVPYNLTFQLDIWTTNYQTKLQILEQILTVFNVSVQLQTNENPFDWSSIFEVFLDDVKWSNRTIPEGGEVQYDFATLMFKVPIWINPAAKEMRRRVIDTIVQRVFDAEIEDDEFFSNELITQCIFTANNLKVSAEVDATDPSLNTITLLNKYGVERDEITWQIATGTYGTIVPGQSAIVLKTDPDIESTMGDIHGEVVAVNGNELTVRIDPDTVPVRNPRLSPIWDIVDPIQTWPGNGLDVAAPGQRYLLLEDVTSDNPNWGTLVANKNDIIEYGGTSWVVIFDSQGSSGYTYIQNRSDGQYYTFFNDEWNFTILGEYSPGYWSIANLNVIENP